MDQHLNVFLTVAEKESFSRAAEIHHMTQPAVSQYIRMFEEDIGTRLLERSNKYVRLNKAGEIVYHYGKEIIGLYTKMQNLVDDITKVATGSLSIGASYTFGEYVLPRIIAHLRQVYPNIEPSVTIGNTALIADLVATNQLDIGIVEGHFNAPQVKKETFAEDEMVVVAAKDHPLVQTDQVATREDLENETWIIREQGSGTREATEKLFDLLKFNPVKKMDFSSPQLIKASVEVGLGISLTSKWSITKELKNGDLKLINLDPFTLKRSFSMITKSEFQTKALEVFIAMLRNEKVLTTLA